MKRRPVILRARADLDLTDAVDHYLAETGAEVALALIAAIEQACGHLAMHPASGSPRYAQELDLPGLRAWRVRRHPYLIFYLAQDDYVDVWRILHSARDIPASLRTQGNDDVG